MNKCQYCEKSFKSERTLSVHMCVKKKRMLDLGTIGSMLGFRVFQRFYDLNSKSKTPKTTDEFIHSKYYLAFVKFGRHLADLNAIDTNAFVDYVISNSYGIDDWCKDSVYVKFLKRHIETESYERAIERTLNEMQQWCESNIKDGDLTQCFRQISTFEATAMIRNGRFSPWVLYLSESGGHLLDTMSEEQIDMLQGILDPVFWKDKFLKQKTDVVLVKDVLRQAGL